MIIKPRSRPRSQTAYYYNYSIVIILSWSCTGRTPLGPRSPAAWAEVSGPRQTTYWHVETYGYWDVYGDLCKTSDLLSYKPVTSDYRTTVYQL